MIIIPRKIWSLSLINSDHYFSSKVISTHQNWSLSFIKSDQRSLKVIIKLSFTHQNWSSFIKSDHYSFNYISLFNQTVIQFWLIRSKAIKAKQSYKAWLKEWSNLYLTEYLCLFLISFDQMLSQNFINQSIIRTEQSTW